MDSLTASALRPRCPSPWTSSPCAALQRALRKAGVKPVVLGRSNRKMRTHHDKNAYKGRNVIERCYCRLKSFKRIATRYDELARNYFSTLCLVAALWFWL
jgi:transposase